MESSKETSKVARPRINVFSENQCRIIFDACLEVLERSGLHIPNGEILSILAKEGCRVENEIVHIPAKLVERSLKTAPDEIVLYNREGEPALKVGGDNTYFGAGADCTSILDSFTGEKRKFITDDTIKGARLQDALHNIAYVMGMGTVSDVPCASVADVVQFEALLCNTSKPINFSAFSTRSALEIIEMASIAAGGEDRLRKKPFIFQFGSGSTPPLAFEPDKLERLLIYADKGIPMVATSTSASGGTAPVTSAGHLVSGIAEVLGSVVMSQARREGAPIIIGLIPLMMDMRSGIFSYGAPEFCLKNSAYTDVLKFLGMPTYGTGGCTDAKSVDEQAAIECTASCMFEMLSGTNLVHDVGYIDSGMTYSFDMLVLADEVIGMARRIHDGIKLDDESLALDVIQSVGHGGTYVSEMHTFEHFKAEQWQPTILNRDKYEDWIRKGSLTLREKANEKVQDILQGHNPLKMDGKKVHRIHEVVERRVGSAK